MQRETGFTLEQIGDMDDDQILFWYTGGKTATPKRHAVEMKMDPAKTWAENMAEFERMKKEWEASNGENR